MPGFFHGFWGFCRVFGRILYIFNRDVVGIYRDFRWICRDFIRGFIGIL